MSSEYYQFHLYPPVKGLNIILDDKIESISAINGVLFVGCNKSGRLLRYQYDQLEDEDETVYFFDKSHEIKITPPPGIVASTIESLQVCQSGDLVVALANETLHCFHQANLETLNILTQRLKPISCFALHDSRGGKEDTLNAKLCVCFKKPSPAIQFFSLESDHFVAQSRECPLPNVAQCVNFCGSVACVATYDRYCLVDLQHGRRTDLFEYPPDSLIPKICVLKKDEFLMVGPGGLGIHACSDSGASTRPPMQWSSHVKDIVFSSPFVLALDSEFVTMHGMQDQEQKQTIAIPSSEETGHCLACSEPNMANQRDRGLILLATSTQIYILGRQTWDNISIQRLKENRLREVSQCLQEEEHKLFNSPASLADLQKKRVERTHCLLGYAFFLRGNFREAQSHFEKGNFDVRELLALYPGLLPAGYKFQSSWQRVWLPETLEKIPEILSKRLKEYEEKQLSSQYNNAASDEEDEKINHKNNKMSPMDAKRRLLYEKYCHFLVQFLEEHRESQLTAKHRLLVETALLKLYADLDAADTERLPLLMATMAAVDVEDIVEYLEKQGHFHTCALMYRWHGNHCKALALWKGLGTGEIYDANFPGLPFVCEILCNLEHTDLVIEHATWILTLSEEEGARVFIERPSDEPQERRPNVKKVLLLLEKYKNARLKYLYHIVTNFADKTPVHHQMLSEDFLRAFSTDGRNKLDKKLRSDFLNFLELSDLYRSQQVLDNLSATKEMSSIFIRERALLYGKMNDLTKALRIYLDELNNPKEAEEFCIRLAKRTENSWKMKNTSIIATGGRASISFSEENIASVKSNIFITLLRLYTENVQNWPRYSQHILHLLNNPNVTINPLNVLALIPNGIALIDLMPFLSRTLIALNHSLSSAEMELSLLERQRQQVRECQLEAASINHAILLRPTDIRSGGGGGGGGGAIDNHLHCNKCDHRIAVEDNQEMIQVTFERNPQQSDNHQYSKRQPRGIQVPSSVIHIRCPNHDYIDVSSTTLPV